MAIFRDISDLQKSIQTALGGWTINQNSEISDPQNGLSIPAKSFLVLKSPSGESIVAVLIQSSLTGSERPKPQIRITTDRAIRAYQYAKAYGYRYFFLVYCATPAKDLKFAAGIDPSQYVVSIESKLTNKTGGRLDIRSMYDLLGTKSGEAFFRATPDLHTCPALTQGAFIRICDSSNHADLSGLKDYIQYFDSRPYMSDSATGTRVVYNPSALYTPDPSPLSMPWNLLVHGAPGTGKSHFLDEQIENYAKSGTATEYKRVTFYEDYSYGQFVGQYMPLPEEDSIQQVTATIPGGDVSGTIVGEHITYRFAPGPFAELLAKSYAAKLNNDSTKFILVIEELNRANAASVFGDVFQLLDRKKGNSIYKITPQREFAQYLHTAVSNMLKPGVDTPPEEAFAEIQIPDNLYIWATMNSADQGVFPLDSAFKRRWSYIYRDIYEVDPSCAFRPRICLPTYNSGSSKIEAVDYDWNLFRTAINDSIINAGFAEDRCIGYWYFSEEELRAIEAYTKATVENKNGLSANNLTALPNPLVDKLYAYLLQDVFRNTPSSFFHDDFGNLSKIRQQLKTLDKGGVEVICNLPNTAYVPNPITP